LSFRDKLNILLEKRLNGVTEQGYERLNGKSQIKTFPFVFQKKTKKTNPPTINRDVYVINE